MRTITPQPKSKLVYSCAEVPVEAVRPPAPMTRSVVTVAIDGVTYHALDCGCAVNAEQQEWLDVATGEIVRLAKVFE